MRLGRLRVRPGLGLGLPLQVAPPLLPLLLGLPRDERLLVHL